MTVTTIYPLFKTTVDMEKKFDKLILENAFELIIASPKSYVKIREQFKIIDDTISRLFVHFNNFVPICFQSQWFIFTFRKAVISGLASSGLI